MSRLASIERRIGQATQPEPGPAGGDEWLTVAEAAARAKVNAVTVRRAIDRDDLAASWPTPRLPRIHVRDFEQWMRSPRARRPRRAPGRARPQALRGERRGGDDDDHVPHHLGPAR